MSASLVDQLKTEISKKRAELQALEKALEALSGSKPTKAKAGGVRKPRTEEQKARQAERMKAMWAAKKAGAPTVKKAKAKLADPT